MERPVAIGHEKHRLIVGRPGVRQTLLFLEVQAMTFAELFAARRQIGDVNIGVGAAAQEQKILAVGGSAHQAFVVRAVGDADRLARWLRRVCASSCSTHRFESV